MAGLIDGTKIAQHGLFYMENITGRDLETTYPAEPSAYPDDDRGPSCFALEEEKGETWKGRGATGPAIKEARPTL